MNKTKALKLITKLTSHIIILQATTDYFKKYESVEPDEILNVNDTVWKELLSTVDELYKLIITEN